MFDDPTGMKRFGFIAVLAPIFVIKHVYVKLNVLQGLYDQLDGAHAKLEINVREQLAMMVKSIEARDPYTSGIRCALRPSRRPLLSTLALSMSL
jgi:hypothetical protein